MVTADLLVLGSTGRVGRLLRALLDGPGAAAAGFAPADRFAGRAPRLLWQVRRGPAGPCVLKWRPGAPLPEGVRARAVLSLWGVTSGSAEALAQNAGLARAALHLGQRIGADRVLHVSSGAVQAGLSGAPAREDGPLAPLGPYGTAKVQMEQAVRDWHARPPGRPLTAPRPRSVVLRLGNVAGADQLSTALARPSPITLDRFATGGGPRRSYIGMADLARTLAQLLALPAEALPAVLNLAGPAPVAMEDLARAAGREVRWKPAPTTALPLMALDTSRLARLIGPLEGSARAGELLAQWRQARVGMPA